MKWKKIGRILVLDHRPKNLKEVLSRFDVDSIVKINKIHGRMREPEIEVLYGGTTETTHKENGCFYSLDLSKVMWSKGNTNERMRISKLVGDGEIVLDMFAGIGYFSIPIALHSNPKKVISIEINPNSFKYLKKNIILNKVQDIVEPRLGDCGELVKDLSVNRVIMGYVKTTHHYLNSAISLLNDGGILHYHETVPDKLINTRPIKRIKKIAKDREVKLLNIQNIKKYAPGVSHVVLDVKIENFKS
ncbi:MAG: class I SAM-dependent methyltransferase family protein [Methanobrevibacter sp.]|jgi:tRNA wybutosine-synthesizing protein 2|nr:class I SAM-dependent methyltransferase family protein [Candidatus Methanovirga aequatorialis]